jgi:epoxyqueuosine reductase
VSAAEKLIQAIEAIGWRGTIVPFTRRAEAIGKVASCYERGELDEKLHEEYLAPMLEEAVPDSPIPRSIVLVAMPSLPVRMQFTLDREPFTVTAAPGYLRGPQYKPIDVVQEALSPFGFAAARVGGPQKTMATLSGFARYGRNNISYVRGLGSFHALASLVTDLPCDNVPSQAQEMLPRCGTCTACRGACPTGAIGEDRFLLRAERCLTFWNEQAAEVPFPDWIDADWPNALFGCLLCQRVCPENGPYLDNVHEGPVFDEATTQLLLGGAKKEELRDDGRPALDAWRLSDLLEYLPRNLGALAKKERLRRSMKEAGNGGRT